MEVAKRELKSESLFVLRVNRFRQLSSLQQCIRVL